MKIGDGRVKRRIRRSLVVLGVVVVAGVTATGASAITEYYYGFNYLDWSSPPTSHSNSCTSAYGYGCAHADGYNYNDRSGMSKVSGDCVHIGFRNTAGSFIQSIYPYCAAWNGTEFDVSRTALGAPEYNRPFCAFWPQENETARSYVKCYKIR